MELSEFSKIVLDKYAKVITDQVFLMIQNDKELMHEYLRVVEKSGLDVTNRHLGKSIKNRFELNNDEGREFNPSSTLIRSHQQFQ